MDAIVSEGQTTLTIKCQGCESECEVTVEIQDRTARCLGGNNCPTGESFAITQAQNYIRSQKELYKHTSN